MTSLHQVFSARCVAAMHWVRDNVPPSANLIEAWPKTVAGEPHIHVVPLQFACSGGPRSEISLTCAVLATGSCAFVAEALSAIACAANRPAGVEVIADPPAVNWSFGVPPQPMLGLRITAVEHRIIANGPLVQEPLHLKTQLGPPTAIPNTQDHEMEVVP